MMISQFNSAWKLAAVTIVVLLVSVTMMLQSSSLGFNKTKDVQIKDAPVGFVMQTEAAAILPGSAWIWIQTKIWTRW